VADYFPTEQTVVHFTEGDCWLLALKMHELTGKPMAFANPLPSDPLYWEHVGLQVSVNRILDIEGMWTPKQWREKWAGSKVYGNGDGVLYYADDPLHIDLFLEGMEPVFVSASRASRVAKRLLETHAPHLLKSHSIVQVSG